MPKVHHEHLEEIEVFKDALRALPEFAGVAISQIYTTRNRGARGGLRADIRVEARAFVFECGGSGWADLVVHSPPPRSQEKLADLLARVISEFRERSIHIISLAKIHAVRAKKVSLKALDFALHAITKENGMNEKIADQGFPEVPGNVEPPSVSALASAPAEHLSGGDSRTRLAFIPRNQWPAMWHLVVEYARRNGERALAEERAAYEIPQITTFLRESFLMTKNCTVAFSRAAKERGLLQHVPGTRQWFVFEGEWAEEDSSVTPSPQPASLVSATAIHVASPTLPSSNARDVLDQAADAIRSGQPEAALFLISQAYPIQSAEARASLPTIHASLQKEAALRRASLEKAIKLIEIHLNHAKGVVEILSRDDREFSFDLSDEDFAGSYNPR